MLSERPTFSKCSLRALLNWLRNRENRPILVLVSIALILHLFLIPYATTPIFDERHYIPAARAAIQGESENELHPFLSSIFTGDEGKLANPQHPTLGKLLIAAGIRVFGDNPWGWRIPAVAFGVASIVLFYFICRKLTGRLAAFLASFLLTFESLTFVHSGLAMLDVFSLTFMLMAFLFCLHDKYVFSGVSLALSGLCKITGLFGGLAILAYWFTKRRKQSPRSVIFFLASSFIAFIVLMPLFDFAATREWISPIDRIWHMVLFHVRYTRELLATPGFDNLPSGFSAYPSYPWEWIFSTRVEIYSNTPSYVGAISPSLLILIVPMMGYMVYEFAKKKTNISLFTLLWFAATFLVWIPIAFVSGRGMYLFYFYPTIGAICIAIGFALKRLWKDPLKGRLTQYDGLRKVAVIGYLTLHVIMFLIFTPILGALASYLSRSST